MPYPSDPVQTIADRPRRKPKQHRRRRRFRSYPLQLLGAATGIALILVVAVLVVEKAAHPYWLGHQVGQEVATLKTRLHAQQKRNAALRQEVRYLQSDEGAEVVARRARYHRPGEEVILLIDDPAAAAAQVTPPAPSSTQRLSQP